MATATLCCASRSSSKYSNEAGYEVYTISEDQLRLKQKMKDRKEGVQVEYVTSRLIVLSCTAETPERKFVETLLTASQQIQKAHNKHFKVWNVSQRRHDVSSCLDAVPFGWPSETAPPLEKLCTVCKNVDQWLLEHPLNVALILCKGGLQRSAVVVNALMRYNAISATDDSVEDRFNMQRFSERFLGPDGPPSYKRYLNYFSSLLSGRISVNSEPLFLHRVVVSHFEPLNVFLKVYERLLPVYQSRTVCLKETTKFEVEGGLKLRGDVFFKCIVAASSPGSSSRCLFTFQLNTCALELREPIDGGLHHYVVRLHKEELDLIFNDKKIDNRVTVELSVSHERGPVTIESAAVQSVQALLPRINSYETFEVAQDEEANRSKLEVEYSEIRKNTTTTSANNNNKEKKKKDKENSSEMPGVQGPPVPPKPATPIMNGAPAGAGGAGMRLGDFQTLPDGVENVPERRGILPASLREKINQKKELEGRATPSIEPDLVGRDRYDKASRCFSYVPAKSMQEAFERPRRTSFSRAIEKRENSMENVSQEEVARAAIPSSRHAEPPPAPPTKWDEQVEDAKQAALLEELARAPSSLRHWTPAAEQQHPYEEQEPDYGGVQVVEQAQRAVVTPTSTLQRRSSSSRPTRAGSYRTLNDDAYCSDMDELCDPEYYLNFNSAAAPPNSAPPVAPPRHQQQHAGARSVQLPRKKLNFDAMTDPLDDVLESTKRLGSAYSVGDVRQNSTTTPIHTDFGATLSNTLNSDAARQNYRNRNCQSVTTNPRSPHQQLMFSLPVTNESRDNEADTWLSGKLKKVRSKRDVDPEIARRRTQEQMLLEELKDTSDAPNQHHQQQHQQYKNSNGHYRGGVDPLADFRREEERLRNTRSPYGDERWRGRMRGKPPTPPPRESSASPVQQSQLPRGGTPSSHQYMEQTRHRHNQSVPLHATARHYDEDFDVNSLFNFSSDTNHQPTSTLERGRSLSRGARIQDAYYASQHDLSSQPPSSRFYSGQERVAAAIYRAETPHRDMYASGATINRAETPGRYFPENSAVLERAATPSFPVSRATPLPFHPLLFNQAEQRAAAAYGGHYSTMNNRSASPRHFGGTSTLSRRSSLNSVDTSEIIHHHPLFVKDTSKYWYKPSISREQAINMLRDKPPGTFVVRDSNSFPGAFGLALKVATPPPGVNPGDGTELVRHFLIEPSPKGVKLKGCNNEPVFGSLSALVYQHSITALALPTKLVLPDFDPAATPEHLSATQALLEQGAACNVVYIGSVDVESLTGNECVKRSIATCSQRAAQGDTRAVSVHFKVSSQGVTLTDNTRKVFFRRHFNVQSVIFAGMDPIERRFENTRALGFHDGCISQARLFAFVARIPSSSENACHVFAELEPEQPATAVVNFINKVMLAQKNRA